MKKKLLAFILIFVLIFSVVSCGGETDMQPDGDTSGESDTQPDGNTSGESEETIFADLGFKNATDAQSFVENFNSSTDGYAYMVESDVQTYEGSLKNLGYSVYRILIWSDKDVENRKDTLGDFEGKSPDNNMNIRLIYNPEGQLVMLKTLFTVSNSSKVAKNNDALSCDAMMKILSALFPENTDSQNREVYESLQLPTIEQIDSYEPKSEYDSSVELIEHFFAHCGYMVDSDAGNWAGAFLEYDCGNQDYRLICIPFGESQDDLYAVYWDISFVLFDDTLIYESNVSIAA